MINSLRELAKLIKQKNEIDERISEIINRPALIGHVGEFIASKIFDIELVGSAAEPAIDGYFRSGKLKGKSVNIKWYPKNERLLDIKYIKEGNTIKPDYYLVMTGDYKPPTSSKGETRPWVIKYVFLFKTSQLIEELEKRGIKIGIATSVRKELWEQAEIYPEQRNKELILKDDQKKYLAMFA